MPALWQVHELDRIFYDRLEPGGWESDEVNACHILTRENEHGVALEIWPVKGEPHALEIEIRMLEPFGSFLFRVEHLQQEEFVVECIRRTDDAASHLPLIEALLQRPQIRVYTLKYYQENRGEKPKECRRRVTLENLPALDEPEFEPISWINFYLAGKVESALVLPREHFELAHRRIAAHYDVDAGGVREVIRKMFYVDPPLDDQGNVVDIPFGGDVWDFGFLDLLKDLFVPGSSMILQDDGHVYWKVVVNPARVEYFRERLCEKK